MVGVETPLVLGGAGATDMREPMITTVEGEIARESDLYYTITVRSAAEPPQVEFDASSTMNVAVERLNAALADRGGGGVLGGAPTADERLRGVLGGDPAALTAILQAPVAQRRELMSGLIELCKELMGDEVEQALAIITALEQSMERLSAER